MAPPFHIVKKSSGDHGTLICYYARERTIMAWTNTSVVTCDSKNGNQKKHRVFKEIGLHAQNLIKI